MKYIPKQGDIIKVDFNPTKGQEQQGFRPAVVVSNSRYNNFTPGFAIVCPITNTDRGFSLHARLDERTKTTGVIITNQAKALDLRQRNISFVERLPNDILERLCDIVSGFSDFDEPEEMYGNIEP